LKDKLDIKLLNTGLDLAMEFGPDWLSPINARMSVKYPLLNEKDLELYDTICRSAMREGHQFVYDTLEQLAKNKNKIDNPHLLSLLSGFLKPKYDWISEEVMGRLMGQGIYYAYKDGIDQALL
jgi:hypothetical protein